MSGRCDLGHNESASPNDGLPDASAVPSKQAFQTKDHSGQLSVGHGVAYFVTCLLASSAKVLTSASERARS
jgi:hypothetical protein